jgi:hypothetical protein
MILHFGKKIWIVLSYCLTEYKESLVDRQQMGIILDIIYLYEYFAQLQISFPVIENSIQCSENI